MSLPYDKNITKFLTSSDQYEGQSIIHILAMYHAEPIPMSMDKVLNDIDRPLSPKGEQDSRKMGLWIVKNIPRLKGIVVGPFQRAQQTAHLLLQSFPEQNYPPIIDSLWLAPGCGPEDIFRIIGQLNLQNNEWGMVILHQPDIQNLLNYLFLDKLRINLHYGDLVGIQIIRIHETIQSQLTFFITSSWLDETVGL